MSRHDHHYISARSMLTKDQDDPDRNSKDLNLVPGKTYHEPNVPDSPAMMNLSPRTEEYSKHSKENLISENGLEGIPKDTECMSSDHDDTQSWSQQSLLSTDRSKSYSQIYSEILEESKERQEKAERAFRVYHINRSKLRRSNQLSLSRGPGSGSYGSSMGSGYSSKSEEGFEEYDSPSTDPSLSCLEEAPNPVSNTDKRIRPRHSKGESYKTELTERCCYQTTQEAVHSYSCPLESRVSKGSSITRHRERSCVCAQESSACSLCTALSRSGKFQSEASDAEMTDGPDYPVDCRSDIPTTATSQSRSQQDYLSSCSTRRRHRPHYHCQRSVPKTYQDRGNSPINIKTRRRTHDYQEPHSEFGSGRVKALQRGRSGASMGVQCPSQDDWTDADWTDWTLDSNTHGDPQLKGREDDWLSSTEEERAIPNKQSVHHHESPIMRRDTNAKEVDIPNSFGAFTCEKHRSVITAHASQRHKDLGQIMTDSHHSFEADDKSEQYAYNHQHSYEEEVCDNNIHVSDKSDNKGSREEGYQLDQDCATHEHDLIHETGPDASSSEVAKSRSFLSLKIYNADEALMEIPEDFEGPAIVLDDDADFLDITLTDDEEKIRAKLMAAALTTRKSSSSISPKSCPKTRPSTEPCSLSYKPSVIFTRRSEVIEDNYAPRPDDRVALLAEKFLQSFSESASDDSGRRSSTQEVSSAGSTGSTDSLHFLGEKGVTKMGGDTPLCGDRQLLSEEFNRKLERQLKDIVESFQ
ncbi:uncharacterized protein LOC6552335 [Drosophila erecta]|nr:uncharacterized protein LOC6552335 [Drosophila erecta]